MSTDTPETMPTLDLQPLLDWIAAQPLHDRLAAADAAHEQALHLVGAVAQARRESITEQVAAGVRPGLSGAAVTNAVRADRDLLVQALHLLLQPGVTGAKPGQLQAGLRANCPINAVARRVAHGMRNLTPGHGLGEPEMVLLRAAQRRARRILPETTQ